MDACASSVIVLPRVDRASKLNSSLEFWMGRAERGQSLEAIPGLQVVGSPLRVSLRATQASVGQVGCSLFSGRLSKNAVARLSMTGDVQHLWSGIDRFARGWPYALTFCDFHRKLTFASEVLPLQCLCHSISGQSIGPSVIRHWSDC